MHILSPFDPLVIQRKRLQLFFDYDHRFEAYLPKEKRVFGYLALPVLVGEDVVAAIDLKTDRANRKLQIQQWTWVGRGSAGRTSGGSRRSCTGSSSSSSIDHHAPVRLTCRYSPQMPHCRPEEAFAPCSRCGAAATVVRSIS